MSRTRAAPTVAVLGRQNVGKSTLVNRLLGRREAIADEAPGVTRDRVEVEVRWGGRSFRVVDTGGFTTRAAGIEALVSAQAGRAAEEAGLVLLVVDATTGIQEEDATLARRLRRAPTPVLVVVNKVDSERTEPQAAEFHALGLGEPIPVSALHGRGSADLLDRIVELLPNIPYPKVEDEVRFALVGRPNVGKSSLFNRLVRQERAVVHEEAGTTRDAIDSVIRIEGRAVRFVDTAGLRRQVKTRGIEYYGLLRAERAVERADVALLVLDAGGGVTGEDRRIAARVAAAGRGLVVALNKWDLVPAGARAERFVSLTGEARVVPGVPVVRTSARSGLGVGRIVPALLSVREAWGTRVPTAEVNRVLEAAVGAHPPARGLGRIRYGTQVAAGPPSFVLFGAGDPGPAYRRYLENALRRAFGFGGVPIRLSFRAREGARGTRRGETAR